MNKESVVVRMSRVLDAEKSRKIFLLNILMRWEAVLLYIFFIMIIANSHLSPHFLDYTNMMRNTFTFMERAIIALPMIFIIICGDIDISTAGIIAVSSVFMGMASSAGVNTWGLVIVGLSTGAAAGFLNGIIITRFRVPAIAVTIGSMALFRGIAFVILGDEAFTQYPESFAFFGQGYIGTIPFPLVLFLLLAMIFGLVLHKTSIGRRVYAIGNNPLAARFSGIPVNKIRLLIFTVTGLCSGLASILLTSRIGSTRPNIALGWELEIIISVLLGGVAITGGKGNIFGVLIAIFLLGFLRFGLMLIDVPATAIAITVGFLLFVAIILPSFIEKLRTRVVLAGH